MVFGNCLFCAFFIWLRYGGRIITSFRPGTRVPHWMVVDRQGNLRHFQVVQNILPWPLCYVVFVGRFEIVRKNSEADYIS